MDNIFEKIKRLPKATMVQFIYEVYNTMYPDDNKAHESGSDELGQITEILYIFLGE